MVLLQFKDFSLVFRGRNNIYSVNRICDILTIKCQTITTIYRCLHYNRPPSQTLYWRKINKMASNTWIRSKLETSKVCVRLVQLFYLFFQKWLNPNKMVTPLKESRCHGNNRKRKLFPQTIQQLPPAKDRNWKIEKSGRINWTSC